MESLPQDHTDDERAAQTSQPSLSEVGYTQESHIPNTEESRWRMILELQQRNMVQLIEAMKPRQAPPSLPQFNPDSSDADARAWCSTIDICMAEQPLEGGALIIALSKALKGSASSWLSQVSHSGMTWNYFKDLFLARYDCAETMAATFITFNSDRPKEGECLAAYAGRLMTTLMSKCKSLTTEEIITSYVLAHTSRFDARVHHLAYTSEITNRSKLLQEMKSFSHLKRKHDRDVNLSDSKRYKPSTSEVVKCNYCGKLGHKAIDCRKRKSQLMSGNNTPKTPTTQRSSVPPSTKKNVICFTCGERGHISSHCPNFGSRGNSGVNAAGSGSGAGASGAQQQRRVDYCEARGVTGQLQHLEEKAKNTEVKSEEQAATKIQAAFRGHRTRKSMSMKTSKQQPQPQQQQQQQPKQQQPKQQEPEPLPTKAELEAEFRADDKELCSAATKIQASFRGHQARKEKEQADQAVKDQEQQDKEDIEKIDLSDPNLNKAATKIQASFRGHKVRKDVKE